MLLQNETSQIHLPPRHRSQPCRSPRSANQQKEYVSKPSERTFIPWIGLSDTAKRWRSRRYLFQWHIFNQRIDRHFLQQRCSLRVAWIYSALASGDSCEHALSVSSHGGDICPFDALCNWPGHSNWDIHVCDFLGPFRPPTLVLCSSQPHKEYAPMLVHHASELWFQSRTEFNRRHLADKAVRRRNSQQKATSY